MELLSLVIESMLSSRHCRGFFFWPPFCTVLKAFSLVCRDWYRRCAPILYRCIYVFTPDIDTLCKCARLHSSGIRLHTTSITVKYDGGISCAIALNKLSRLAELLLHVTSVQLQDMSHNKDIFLQFYDILRHSFPDFIT